MATDEVLARALADAGVDLARLGLAWARVAPTVAIVPAFGLRALPAPARAVLALALAASLAPGMAPAAVGPGAWPLALLGEVLRGLPVALAAAIPLWAATMAGGLADSLRGAGQAQPVAVVEERASPLGLLLSLFASATFLALGGPAHVLAVLASPPADTPMLLGAVRTVLGGVGLAVALAAPLLGGAVVLEVTFALVARAASPTQVGALVAPLRSVAVLALAVLALEAMARLLAAQVTG